MASPFVFLLLLFGYATTTNFYNGTLIDWRQGVDNEDETRYSRCKLITDLKKKVEDGSMKQADIEKKLLDEIENKAEDLEKKLLDVSEKQIQLETKLSDLNKKLLDESKMREDLEKKWSDKFIRLLEDDVEIISIPDRKYVLVKKDESRNKSEKYCQKKFNTSLASFNSSMQGLQLNKELYKIEIRGPVWTGGYSKSKTGNKHHMAFIDGKKWPSDICTTINCGSKESCKDTVKGKEYYGNIAVTHSGRKCQKWSSQTPHKHPQKGEQLVENYCRNPTNGKTPWCYTMDKNRRWEYCDIPMCNYDCKTSWKGEEYKGTLSTTRSGKKCRNWSSSDKDEYKSLDGNYCRNPNKSIMPWCYTTDPNTKFDYCDVPNCTVNWGFIHPTIQSSVVASYPAGSQSRAFYLFMNSKNTMPGWFLCNFE